jgi:hypothetical protein
MEPELLDKPLESIVVLDYQCLWCTPDLLLHMAYFLPPEDDKSVGRNHSYQGWVSDVHMSRVCLFMWWKGFQTLYLREKSSTKLWTCLSCWRSYVIISNQISLLQLGVQKFGYADQPE